MLIQQYQDEVGKLCSLRKGLEFLEANRAEVERYRSKSSFRRWIHRTFTNWEIAKLSAQLYFCEILNVLEEFQREQEMLVDFFKLCEDEVCAYDSIKAGHRFLYRIEPHSIGIVEYFKVKKYDFHRERFSSRLLKIYQQAEETSSTWLGNSFTRFIKQTRQYVMKLNREVQDESRKYIRPVEKEVFWYQIERQSERVVHGIWKQFFQQIKAFRLRMRQNAAARRYESLPAAIPLEKKRKSRVIRFDKEGKEIRDGEISNVETKPITHASNPVVSSGVFKAKKTALVLADIIQGLKTQDTRHQMQRFIEKSEHQKPTASEAANDLLEFAREMVFNDSRFNLADFQLRMGEMFKYLTLKSGTKSYENEWRWLVKNQKEITNAKVKIALHAESVCKNERDKGLSKFINSSRCNVLVKRGFSRKQRIAAQVLGWGCSSGKVTKFLRG